ncbi:hypothetical protein AK88_00050 [Plasmodium fragile]|uniref:RRM domain-containing protein n=1 Tax=Plasmodium fragile TaxID=5857 RepID=A0A0D9QTK8_PLAFR|nr:uncharacterized protein AK88_00050 [Plasmodium fragile]KJP90202.1 hypothetical protein AK88_00050 [Plasmodium fragile]
MIKFAVGIICYYIVYCSYHVYKNVRTPVYEHSRGRDKNGKEQAGLDISEKYIHRAFSNFFKHKDKVDYHLYMSCEEYIDLNRYVREKETFLEDNENFINVHNFNNVSYDWTYNNSREGETKWWNPLALKKYPSAKLTIPSNLIKKNKEIYLHILTYVNGELYRHGYVTRLLTREKREGKKWTSKEKYLWERFLEEQDDNDQVEEEQEEEEEEEEYADDQVEEPNNDNYNDQYNEENVKEHAEDAEENEDQTQTDDAADDRKKKSPSRETPQGRTDEMTDNCLHVFNLTKNVSEDHLKEIFMNFGNLKDIHISLDEENVSRTNGGGNFISATIKFENEMDARVAKEYMNGGQIDGKTVSIKYVHEGKSKGKHKHTSREHSIKREHKDRTGGDKKKRLKDGRRSSSSPSGVSEYSSRRSSSTEERRKTKSTRRR